jgi:hypothetical protein
MEWIDIDAEFGILGLFIVSLLLQYLDRKIEDIKRRDNDIKKEDNLDDGTE